MANKEGTMKIQHAYCKDRRGFTLVELLVVMVIVGLLVALVGPKVFPKLGKGKQAAAKHRSSFSARPWTIFAWTWAAIRPHRKVPAPSSQTPERRTGRAPISRRRFPTTPGANRTSTNRPVPTESSTIAPTKGWHARGGSEDKDVVNWE